MELNNILMNSLDISVAAAIKHFVACSLNDYISVTRDVNVQPLNAGEIEAVLGFFEDCETYLANAENGVLLHGDDAITGRHTLSVIDYLGELQAHRERLLAHRLEMLTWAAAAEVEMGMEEEIDEEEFFAILYHAYAKLRTDMLVNFYHDTKAETLAKYGITLH
jgi:hypothetical protein